MTDTKPALSLTAVPGRRRRTLELAAEIESRGFTGIFVPSPLGGTALCHALAHATNHIPFGTSIAPLHARVAEDYAQDAAFLHEISGGRFRLGIGISHGPTLSRWGVEPGRPLADVRGFAEHYRSLDGMGDKAPLILATLRRRMIALAAEMADGMVFANGARSHMATSLAVAAERRHRDPDFFVGDMIPTCISDDIEAAKAVNRRTLSRYVRLPNYRNYWKEAGYQDEMEEIERAIDAGEDERIPQLLHDRWLAGTTLFGPAAKVREGVEAWRDAGVTTPILVPSSAAGNQMVAFQEIFAAFD